MSGPSGVEPAVIGGRDLSDLQAWASDVEAWPAGSHAWGHYAEDVGTGTVICRTENVSACHPGFRSVVEGPLRTLAAAALATAVVDFKDKINYKHPGGGGFRPHQDVVAYPGAAEVASIVLAIDECTLASGCLWLARDVDEPLPTDGRGVIERDVVSSLEWHPAEMSPGDALCLFGCTPHFSKANTGPERRRVLVVSYSPVGDGYTRDRYYADRAAVMAASSARDGRRRISTLADFEGDIVDPGAPGPAGRCTHPAGRA